MYIWCYCFGLSLCHCYETGRSVESMFRTRIFPGYQNTVVHSIGRGPGLVRCRTHSDCPRGPQASAQWRHRNNDKHRIIPFTKCGFWHFEQEIPPIRWNTAFKTISGYSNHIDPYCCCEATRSEAGYEDKHKNWWATSSKSFESGEPGFQPQYIPLDKSELCSSNEYTTCIYTSPSGKLQRRFSLAFWKAWWRVNMRWFT